MMKDKESFNSLKTGCKVSDQPQDEKGAQFNKDIFEMDWEVFVIKQDKASGKLVGRVACCALASV